MIIFGILRSEKISLKKLSENFIMRTDYLIENTLQIIEDNHIRVSTNDVKFINSVFTSANGYFDYVEDKIVINKLHIGHEYHLLRVISHELIHSNQWVYGYLTVDDGNILWKNQKVNIPSQINYFDFAQYLKDYSSTYHEFEAYAFEDIIASHIAKKLNVYIPEQDMRCGFIKHGLNKPKIVNTMKEVSEYLKRKEFYL